MARESDRPSSAKKFLLLLASVILCVGVAEVAMRFVPPSTLGFSYADGRFMPPLEFVEDDQVNSYGFHDVEPGYKPSGGFRIVLLGDSYVAARSVAVDEIVGQRLQHHLGLGPGVDVVSLGQPGWGQKQQLAALRQIGPALDPDLVITLFLSLNDVKNNHPVLQARGRAQRASIPAIRPGWLNLAGEDAPLFCFERSVLNQLLSVRLALTQAKRASGEIPLDYLVYAETYGPIWNDAWEYTERLLQETRATSERLGAEYAVVSASTPQGVRGADEWRELLTDSFPAMEGRSFRHDKPDRLLRKISARNGFPFLALEPGFGRLTRDDGQNLHWPIDGHWNVEGNDEAGRAIAAFVREQGLLAGAASPPRDRPAADPPR